MIIGLNIRVINPMSSLVHPYLEDKQMFADFLFPLAQGFVLSSRDNFESVSFVNVIFLMIVNLCS